MFAERLQSTYQIDWPAAGINQTFTSDNLANVRLSLWFNASNVPILYLNGVVVQTGTAQPAGGSSIATLTLTHNATGITSNYAPSIYTGEQSVITSTWGACGRGSADYHQLQLAANSAAGGAATAENVNGEALCLIWSNYAGQLSRVAELINKITGTFLFIEDIFGTIVQSSDGVNTNILFDASIYAPSGLVYGSYNSFCLQASSLEAATVSQITGAQGVSTVVIADVANTASLLMYEATPSNYTGTVEPVLVAGGYTTAELPTAYINQGLSAVLPNNPTQAIGSYNFQGFFTIYPGGGMAAWVSEYKGGFSATPVTPAQLQASASVSVLNPTLNADVSSIFGEPIDAFTGNFTYNRSDIQVGSQGFPYGLSFQRFYNSRNQYQSSGLGRGWTHNYDITARVSSDGLLAMGTQYALQGVATVAALFVLQDLLSDTTMPVTKVTMSALVGKWFLDHAVNNTVVIEMPDSLQIYCLQPDGSYTPPLNNANTLSLSGGLYTLMTPQKLKMTFNASGQITGWTFPSGATVTCNYTSGVLTSITTLGRTLTLAYTSGALTSVTDGSRTVSYAYDINGNLTKFTDTNLQALTYQYDQPGRMTKYFKPANPTTAFATNVYDTLSRVMTQADALNHTWTYFFAGSRGEEDDPLGNAHVRYFNRNGAVVRDIDAAGNETDYFYDGLNRLTQSILPEGNQKLYTYDSNNNVLSLTAVAKPGSGLANIVNSFTYDPTWALVKTATDGKSQVTTYNYDPTLGNLLTIQRPLIGGVTPTVSFTHNARGQVLTATDETGIVTQNTYSTTNETLTKQVVDYSTGTGHLNLTTQFGYDAAGNTNSVTDPNTNITTSMYDTERRLTQVTAPTPFGYLTTRAYDANSNLLNVQQQTGVTPAYQITSWTYSVTDKKLTVTDPAGDVTNFAYDGKDRLASVTDAMNRETQFSYDVRDNNYQTTDATGTISDTRLYTPNNLLASVQDARSSLTQYNYDGFDRPNQTIYADTTYEQNVSYDANSNVLTARTRAGNQIVNTFDVLNRLSTKAPASQPTVTFGYDLAGRLLSATKLTVSGDPSSGAFSKLYDTAGRFYQESYPDGKQVTFGLDSNGNVTKLTYPDGYYVTRSYDALNRLSNIYLNGSTTAAAALAYDELSRRTSLTYNNGASVGYSYASPVINDLTNIVHNFVGSNVAFGYGYNLDHEITGQSVTDGSYQWQPTVGSVAYGTATSVNEYPSVGGTTYSYNGDACLTGNGVWTFGYDTEDHLTSASKTGTSVAYVYDGFHRQAQKSVTTSGGTVASRYIYSGWQRIADYDGVAGTLQNRYVYTDGLDEPLIQVTSAGVVTYYHANAQGSIIGVSNSAGAVTSKNLYGTFGETVGVSGTTFGFTGQRYDGDTGLYYYKNRYYSPTIGRFLQTDPLGYVDDLNIYSYVSNNPFTSTDPLGLVAEGTGSNVGARGEGGGNGSGNYSPVNFVLPTRGNYNGWIPGDPISLKYSDDVDAYIGAIKKRNKPFFYPALTTPQNYLFGNAARHLIGTSSLAMRYSDGFFVDDDSIYSFIDLHETFDIYKLYKPGAYLDSVEDRLNNRFALNHYRQFGSNRSSMVQYMLNSARKGALYNMGIGFPLY
ncbi:MAG: RHS repeat-associated core domain-containing protein [Candidatus Obscuribacterales bacterium]|nr:RHS repeat-associated core domain-containing protein [Candidatus Obscuribacterales bacterium]